MTDFHNQILCGDCLEVMASMPESYVSSIVTDPPYGLRFMGKGWDSVVPGVEVWREALRVTKPGGYLLAFGGTRTWHRLAVAIEDAGWEVRDCLMWLYGGGMPKSYNFNKGIDKTSGEAVGWFGPWLKAWRKDKGISQSEIALLFPSKTGGKTGCVANWELGYNLPTNEQFNLIVKKFGLPFASLEEARRSIISTHRESGKRRIEILGTEEKIYHKTLPKTEEVTRFSGYGSALKPAWEPIILAMKPLDGTYANNALVWGQAGLDIDGCRVGGKGGRWPANVLFSHDPDCGEGQCVEGCAVRQLDEQSGISVSRGSAADYTVTGRQGPVAVTRNVKTGAHFSDRGGASRFFYCAKASSRERGEGNNHPTVKPLKLMSYLVRLVTPPSGGLILDPFAGSGSTLLACDEVGVDYVGIEKEQAYCDIIESRLLEQRFLKAIA